MTATHPIEKLVEDHRIIQRVLLALELLLRDLDEKADAFPYGFFELALQFLSQFAERCHVAKEEERLFPLLWEKGVRLEKGPLGQLMEEHERSHRQLNAMALYLEAAREGRKDAIQAFLAEIREYLRSMREHLEREELRIFKAARTLFTPADWERLRREFEEVENVTLGRSFQARYEAIAERLIAAVPRAR